MNGVAAVLSRPGDDTGALLDGMLERMPHRTQGGGERYRWLGRGASLAQAGAPIPARGPLRIVVDARLANRRDLADQLGEEGDDATLILAAYERWGADAIARLEGDFAGVIADGDELFCFRDAFGLRPLHYAVVGDRFLVASEIRALFAEPSLVPRPDPETLALRVIDDYAADDRTLFQGIHELPPGHWARVRTSSLTTTRFWSPDPHRRSDATAEALADELAEALDRSVAGRLDGVATAGVLTSGGLDSNLVAASGVRSTTALTLLHVAFPGLDCDERAECEATAAHLDVPTLVTDAMDLVDHRPAPLAHPDAIYDPRWAVWPPILKQAGSAGITRVLTGEGGDLTLPPDRDAIGGALARADVSTAWTLAQDGANAPRAAGRMLRAAARTLLPRGLRRPKPSGWILAAAHRERQRSRQAARRARFAAGDYPDGTTRAMFELLELLARSPVNAMLDQLAVTSGVELLHPWLDRRVVELVLRVPHRMRHAPGSGYDKPKPLMRRIAAERLPRSVATRAESAEYSGYLIEVLRHHRPFLHELLATSRLVEMGIVDGHVLTDGSLDRALDDHYGLLVQISNVIGLELWLRQL